LRRDVAIGRRNRFCGWAERRNDEEFIAIGRKQQEPRCQSSELSPRRRPQRRSRPDAEGKESMMSPFLWFIWWSDFIAAYAPKEKPRKPELRVIEGGRRRDSAP
jgi:hypothetical protein